jgi:hypothetical protein
MNKLTEQNYFDAMIASYMRSFAYETLITYLMENGLDTSDVTEEFVENQLKRWEDG